MHFSMNNRNDFMCTVILKTYYKSSSWLEILQWIKKCIFLDQKFILVMQLRAFAVLKPRMVVSGATSGGLLALLGLFAKLLMGLKYTEGIGVD